MSDDVEGNCVGDWTTGAGRAVARLARPARSAWIASWNNEGGGTATSFAVTLAAAVASNPYLRLYSTLTATPPRIAHLFVAMFFSPGDVTYCNGPGSQVAACIWNGSRS
jgi:hypothetical protein